MLPKPHHIFLDLETTGLDRREDQITEAAWVADDGVKFQAFVEHTKLPTEWVLKKTDYLTRIAPADKIRWEHLADQLRWTSYRLAVQDQTYMDVVLHNPLPKDYVQNVYLVGANPAFDDAFLQRVLNIHEYTHEQEHGLFFLPQQAYNYHVFDIEAAVAGALKLKYIPKLKELRGLLGMPGANPAPHTAPADADEVKAVWDFMYGN